MAAQSRPTVLITRPDAPGARLAEALAARLGAGAAILRAPLMETRFLAPALPGDLTEGRARGLVFTAESGVAGFARLWPRRDLTAWCVGPRTAEAAAAAGWQARALGGDAVGLAAALVAEGVAGPLVHPQGAHVTAALGTLLAKAGPALVPVVVYEQVALPLSQAARALLAGTAPVVVPLFSPRSARLFVAAAGGVRAPLLVAAISAAAADPAQSLAPARLVIAAQPDGPAMIDAVADLVAQARAA
jgi:uroporphyrinogen-III synthase